jgi:hypothetical protein
MPRGRRPKIAGFAEEKRVFVEGGAVFLTGPVRVREGVRSV